jgi:cytochrome c peroxidase
VATLNDFTDKGLGAITGRIYDNGRFKVPSLRNIALTAPYMHDGRFSTLGEVLDHYKTGGHGIENEDVNIIPFTLSEGQKQDMISFLNTLTDTTFLNNPAFKNPFN